MHLPPHANDFAPVTFNDPRLTHARSAIVAVMSGDAVEEHESEILDFKEDITMRGPQGHALPGAAEDEEAARYYGHKACCLSNHQGGSLVIGVNDKRTGSDAVLGSGLDGQWLVNRIRQLTEDPPLTVGIQEEHVAAKRVLILLVPRNSGSKPHSIRSSRKGPRVYPRRTQKNCHNMEFDELVEWRQGRSGYDWSAAPSGLGPAHARAAALEALRDFLRESDEPSRRELADQDDPARSCVAWASCATTGTSTPPERSSSASRRRHACDTCTGPAPVLVRAPRSNVPASDWRRSSAASWTPSRAATRTSGSGATDSRKGRSERSPTWRSARR